MRAAPLMLTVAATLALAPPAVADGPESVQARAANAAFLAEAPAPPEPGAVCVIDSGVDLDTDVAPAVVRRFADDGGSLDDLGAQSDTGVPLAKHGTYVAGVIASQIDGTGSSGIWPRARIVSVRVFGGPGSTTTAAAYVRAIQRCINQPNVKVINLSLAGLDASVSQLANLEGAVVEARATYGINVVASAGNQGLGYVAYPAQLPPVFAVGATTPDGNLAPFSNRGAGLDISAIGVDVCLSYRGAHGLATATGTSFAAPVVSAALAAMRSYDPTITVAEAEDHLIGSARGTSSGLTLDIAAAFRVAGLGELVDTYRAAAPGAACSVVTDGNSAASGQRLIPADDAEDPSPEPQAPGPVAIEPPQLIPLNGEILPPAELVRPDRPNLRSLTFRRGRLRIEVTGYRPGMTTIFTVNGKRFERRGNALRVRTRRWRVVRVRLSVPGAGASPPLTIRRATKLGSTSATEYR